MIVVRRPVTEGAGVLFIPDTITAEAVTEERAAFTAALLQAMLAPITGDEHPTTGCFR